MDTSKEYIEMCRKAAEIQKKILLYDDYYYVCGSDGVGFWEDMGVNTKRDGMTIKWFFGGEDLIWLPRQDQLQDMLYNPINTNAVSAMFEEVSDFGLSMPYTDNSGKTDGIDLTSGEQLWLAFVMHEKYGKKWINGEWKPL